MTAQSTSNAFEGLFATRGNMEAPEANCVGAFDQVFVKRGRWRKSTSDQPHGNVIQLAEHVAAGDHGLLADMKILDPIMEDPVKSVHPNTTELWGDRLDSMPISEINDTIQFVVKNTFLNTASFVGDFLSERLVQSCPAGSFNIEDNMGMEDVSKDADFASNEVSMNTVSSWRNLRTMSFDDTGVMNTATSWQNLRTVSFDDANFMTDSLCKGSVFNTDSTFADVAAPHCPVEETVAHKNVSCDFAPSYGAQHSPQAMLEQQMLIQDRLNTLRLSGSSIQRNIAEAIAPALDLSMQLGQMEVCFSQPPVGPPAFDVPRLPTPPPPPAPSAVLRLAEALPPPELGGPLAPSLGSLLHHCGECRPCTFFHTRGCQNAEQCEFCHLCGPGEKKKRLRAEKAAKRHSQEAAVQNARAILASLDAAEANAEVDYIVE